VETVQVRVPKAIHALLQPERQRLLHHALRIAAKYRARELEQDCKDARAHIRRLEKKYRATFSQFERKKLRRLNTVQAHEDYNDWFFWTKLLERAERELRALSKMESVR